ncbi:MAG: 3-hydroxyacyl-CoA dehydrogenase family protein [Dehalococcoidia bacterium]|uniref:3-hydroxyacyl-CoA dehydrogenase C-terminal domain-containing protein n=1 Tax=marine metagenome TaxID=408172 RepID=A0A381V2L1_9ZZZZ|nr:3-hydroxyacyl-CoA dehydrogenase family protein [Dehalococcoidia bacterium]|tara:strand:+ start:886 stop:1287 length:402 start_codon:yes stop_codon:yes gene_type:complete
MAQNRQKVSLIETRLRAALFRECLALVEDEVASPEDIDTVVKNTIGRRLAVGGPFEIWEQIGWDLVQTIAGELFKEISNSEEPVRSLRNMVNSGQLGVETGSGFYEWSKEDVVEIRHRFDGSGSEDSVGGAHR